MSWDVPCYHLLLFSDLPPVTEPCPLWTNGFGKWFSSLSQRHKHPDNNGAMAESGGKWRIRGFSVWLTVDQRPLDKESPSSLWTKCRLADPESASKSRKPFCKREAVTIPLKENIEIVVSASIMMSKALSPKDVWCSNKWLFPGCSRSYPAWIVSPAAAGSIMEPGARGGKAEIPRV